MDNYSYSKRFSISSWMIFFLTTVMVTVMELSRFVYQCLCMFSSSFSFDSEPWAAYESEETGFSTHWPAARFLIWSWLDMVLTFFSFFSCQGWPRVCSFPLPWVSHALSNVQIGLNIFIDSRWHLELTLALVLGPCCHIIKQTCSKFHVLFCEEHCFFTTSYE